VRIKNLLEPKAIAVFGVSRSNPFHPANVIYTKNRLRYSAKSFAVNPNGGDLYGDIIYRNIEQIPVPIDLAVFAMRADFVPKALRESIDAGITAAVVISGGFAESGREDLQEEIREIALQHDFPLVGPNCLGVYSPPHMDTFFLSSERMVHPIGGSVALISQSGGILIDLVIQLTEERVGINNAISIGNKAVIDEVDLLKYFNNDPATSVIGMYIEGFSKGRGREFVNVLKKCNKPVVMMKSGKTPGGTKAVSSHTASIAGDYQTFHEVMKQSGVLEANCVAEFAAYCEGLSCYPKKRVKKLCIITGSGGHGAAAADDCYKAGLELIQVSESDQQSLREKLSRSIQSIATLCNPVDLTGSASDADIIESARFFLERDDVDALILLLLPYLPGITPDVGARIAQLARQMKKPILTYIPHVDKFDMFCEGFESNGAPVAHSVEGVVNMAIALMRNGS
jgi:acyl-CoA synthetase (NDP forming)